MASFAEPMSRLIDELRKLPGVGTKSAQRLAFHVLRSSNADARALAAAILTLREQLRLCSICNNVTDTDPCIYCSGAVRDQHLVCVVEEPTNIATIERTRSYNGVYHVLHGTLSPIGGVGPEQLRIANLLTRVAPSSSNGSALDAGSAAPGEAQHADDRAIREIILATSPTTEGEATAAYIADELRRIAPDLRITRIATGVPAGSDIEYADEVTMSRALEGRREF
ncbi:MAG TPA: recombination mediator RecR [Acidobacteriaceae bacterium]